MRVLAHVDPVALEQELLRRIDGIHPREPGAQTLILVPTALLADHVRRRLSSVRPAWLGVEVLSFHGLAHRILGLHAVAGPTVLSGRVLEVLLRRILARRPENRWSRFVDARPGALRRLLSTFGELREAGIDPDTLDSCGDETDRDLGEIYRDYHAEIRERADSGWVDDAGLVHAALPHATTFASRWKSIFVHGAYELTGMHVDLICRLDAGSPLTVLVPVAPGARVSRYGEDFVRAHLLAWNENLTPIGDAGADAPLSGLFVEERRGHTVDRRRIAARHTQGAADEIKIAVREALAAGAEGCPPSDIVIAARSLELYAASIEAVLEEEGMPWTSTLATPLRRQPVVRDFVTLLKILVEDFPRRPTVELLRSNRIDWRSIDPDHRPARGRQADRWSRRAGIVGGLESWRTELVRVAGEAAGENAERRQADESTARRVIGTLEKLVLRMRPTDRLTWAEHARRLRHLRTDLCEVPVGDKTVAAAVEALDDIVDDMGRLETVVGDKREIDLAEAQGWLETAVGGSDISLWKEDRGGLRVLDAMQLRGMTFRHLHLIGLNSGVLPRVPREDPVLRDSVRLELRRQTGRPLPVKSRGGLEEQLLLGMVLGCANERVDVSWQRADEAGRSRTPSLALREVARLVYGRPDMKKLCDEARHVASHPAHALRDLLESPGLLSPSDEKLLASLESVRIEDLGWLAERYPELSAGIRMLRATQSFTPVDGAYDALVDLPEVPEPLSVSALGTLGDCPLQFFFQRVLRVRELDAEPHPFLLPAHELGRVVHDVLEQVYRGLVEAAAFDPERHEEAGRLAVEILESRWGKFRQELERRTGGRFSRLAEMESRRWLDSVRGFVRADVERLALGQWTPDELELQRERTLEFSGRKIAVLGRLDRLLVGPKGTLVGDYKTSGDVERKTDPTGMLKAKQLQVPLYAALTGHEAGVEVLGVGPRYEGAEERGRFDGFGDLQTGFDETMGVLLDLARGGVFPLHPERMRCGWCAYRRACRQNHQPTLDRMIQIDTTNDFRDLKEKSRKKSTLELVRADPRYRRRQIDA